MAAPTIDNFLKPKYVTGGCLCGSIRYRIDFPENHDFLRASGSCQCTQCRRGTGSLFLPTHAVPKSSVTFTFPTPTSSSTLKNYEATPGCQRGICTNCGSSLYWQDVKSDAIEIAVGCIDPGFLFNGSDHDGEQKGKGSKENGGFGFALANMAGANVWCRNEIPGVTDFMIGKERGMKFAGNSGS